MGNLLLGLGILGIGWLINVIFDNTLTNYLRIFTTIIGLVYVFNGGCNLIDGSSREDITPSASHIESSSVDVYDYDEEYDHVSNSTNDNTQKEVEYNSYDNNSYESPEVQVRELRRYQCRACNASGSCRVCEGTGRTKSHLSYSYNDGAYLTEEDCSTCRGTGKCQACGGDGYLDEGVDF